MEEARYRSCFKSYLNLLNELFIANNGIYRSELEKMDAPRNMRKRMLSKNYEWSPTMFVAIKRKRITSSEIMIFFPERKRNYPPSIMVFIGGDVKNEEILEILSWLTSQLLRRLRLKNNPSRTSEI